MDKIYELLKNKFSSLGYSDKTLKKVAISLSEQNPSEDNLETLVNGVEPLLKAFQSEFDTVRTERDTYKKTVDSFKTKTTERKEDKSEDLLKDEKKSTEAGEEMPAWAKAVIESNQSIAKELAGIKTSTVAQSRKQILEQKLKDVPEKLKAKAIKDFERMQFDNDESFNTYVDETEADLKDIIQVDREKSVGANSIPLLSSGGGKLGDTEVSPMMKAFITNRTKTVEAVQPAKAV